MEDTNKMKKHVAVVGAIQIGFGFIGLIGALAVFFGLNFAKGVVGNEEIPSMVLGFLMVSLPLLIGFLVDTRACRRYWIALLSVMGKVYCNDCVSHRLS